MSGITQINCYYNKGDSIASLEVCNSGSVYIGEMYFMCENKHVLKYYKNPDGTIVSDSLSNYFDSFNEKYPLFFKSTPIEVFIHFEYIRNFMITEYFSGAAYSIRTLAERIIYENYGVYLFSNKQKLSDYSDKGDITDISEIINKINFGKLITLLMSSRSREKVLNSNNQCDDLKLNGEGLKYAKNASQKINGNSCNIIFLKKKDFQLIQEVYDATSPALHGRHQMDSSRASENLEKVLKFYQAYFENGNEWRTLYDR